MIVIICVINVQMDDCVHKCTEALVVPEVITIIGANLSEINTSARDLIAHIHVYAYRFVGLERPLTANKLINFMKVEHLAGNRA